MFLKNHKRRKCDSSRDSSGARRKSHSRDKNRSLSRKASLSASLNRILALLTDQGNWISMIQANSHVPETTPSNPLRRGSPHHVFKRSSGQLGVGSKILVEAELSQASDPVQLQLNKPEEVSLTHPISVQQTEGKRLNEVSCE